MANEALGDDDAGIAMRTIYGVSSDYYDYIDQMIIPDFALFKRGLADSEIVAELVALHRTEADYVDHARSDYWFTSDIPQIIPPKDYRATGENTILKLFYVAHRLPRLSMQEAQLHWQSCHGGMAREFKDMLPFLQYVQAHRHASKVLDGLKETLGGGFEDDERILGQAEAWFDRNVLALLQGPEAARMIQMLVADIAIFVEAAVSPGYVAKEHVFVDQPLYAWSAEIPVLYNLD